MGSNQRKPLGEPRLLLLWLRSVQPGSPLLLLPLLLPPLPSFPPAPPFPSSLTLLSPSPLLLRLFFLLHFPSPPPLTPDDIIASWPQNCLWRPGCSFLPSPARGGHTKGVTFSHWRVTWVVGRGHVACAIVALLPGVRGLTQTPPHPLPLPTAKPHGVSSISLSLKLAPIFINPLLCELHACP